MLLPLSLGACSKSETDKKPVEQASAVSVHDEMVTVVIPQTQAIWDVSNASLNDEGSPDPTKVSDADWQSVKAASSALMTSLDRLATANRFLAAKPGDKIMDQDIAGAAQPKDVQARLDANPQGFRDHAKTLSDFIKAINGAAAKKDFKTFSERTAELDGACEGCHKAYWLK
ncbi:hypothetical protein WSK_0137 [Novosphingobium sp. Rr 2-17]|nr:hypothetical protein WSK_0137 [Novosphingobium sp. Rr 2-17]